MPVEPGLAARRVDPTHLPSYFTFPLIDERGVAFCAFSTRLGGCSPPPFDSLNIGTTTRDDVENVRVNRARLSQAWGYPVEEWVQLEHGNAVHRVDVPNAVFTACTRLPGGAEGARLLPVGDALVTAQRGLPLTIYTADCVPLVILDPDTPAIGVVHAGWRGTVADVAAATVTALQTHYGARPARMLCGVGASIGPCCFEVDRDVSDAVRESFPQWQDLVVRAHNEKKSSVDLWELNTLQLERAGISRQNIAVSRLCTSCRTDLFYSYRRDRRETGRLALLAALR